MLWTVSRLAGGRGDKDWEGDMKDSDRIRFLFASPSTSPPPAQPRRTAYLKRMATLEFNERRSQFYE